MFVSFNLTKVAVAKQVIAGLYKGVSTQELDTLAAETAATMTTVGTYSFLIVIWNSWRWKIMEKY